MKLCNVFTEVNYSWSTVDSIAPTTFLVYLHLLSIRIIERDKVKIGDEIVAWISEFWDAPGQIVISFVYLDYYSNPLRPFCDVDNVLDFKMKLIQNNESRLGTYAGTMSDAFITS